MADTCSYEILVTGTQKAAYAVYSMERYLDDKHIIAEGGTESNYYLLFVGDCKWSLTWQRNDNWQGGIVNLDGIPAGIIKEESLDDIYDGYTLRAESGMFNCRIDVFSEVLETNQKQSASYEKGNDRNTDVVYCPMISNDEDEDEDEEGIPVYECINFNGDWISDKLFVTTYLNGYEERIVDYILFSLDGELRNSVTKKTDYLISAEGAESAKAEKARELKRQGSPIEIMSFAKFISRVEYAGLKDDTELLEE